MSADTQWPRYQVFQQERPDQPHKAVGTVHAVDSEMALLNARDVYARRPRWHNLWVIADDLIFSRTAEELAAEEPLPGPPAAAEGEAETFLVFQKRSQRRSMTFTEHVGQVEARAPEEALARALAQFDGTDVSVWWVLPEAALARTGADDVSSWFEPVEEKIYRQQSHYGRVQLARLAPPEEPS